MIGIITGSGQYCLDALRDTEVVSVDTRYGPAEVTLGKTGKAQVAHIARHGKSHELLSNMINHRANLTALKKLGVRTLISSTVVGVIDPSLHLAVPIIFDDLFFPENRLPEGQICTVFDEPGSESRAHCIFSSPYSSTVRAVLAKIAEQSGLDIVDTGTYGHVNGPRFNSRSEIAWLRANKVTAISQTAGPETILAAELQIPFALVGFGVDYANGVATEPTPMETLDANLESSASVVTRLLLSAAESLAGTEIENEIFLYRF